MPGIPLAIRIDAFATLGAFFAPWKGGRTERAGAIIVIVNAAVRQTVGAWRRRAVRAAHVG